MANDNTLGAPTEGLGQTVTFAASGRQGVPQTTAMKRGGVRNTAQGGAARRTAEALQTPAPQGDTTFKTLARLAGDIIKPQLEAERTLKFAEGWQKAAQSQAIEEIVDEQPAFSRLFGSSSLVDGARAYTAAAKANGLAIELESDMVNLRKLSPAEVAKHVADRVTATAGTGDATTNAMIIQQASQGVPQFLKGQAKAYLGYQQELRGEAQAAQLDTQFDLVNIINIGARDPDSRRDLNDVIEASVQALNNMSRDTETSPDLFSKMLSTSAIKALNNGNLTAYQLLAKSNKIAELTPDDQYKVKRAHSVAVNDAKLKVPDEFNDQLVEFAVLSTRPDTTPDIVKAKRDSINASWKRLSGDDGDYVGGADLRSELIQLDTAQRQREAAAAREAAHSQTIVGKAQQERTDLLGALAKASNFADPDSFMVANTPKERAAIFDAARQVHAGDPARHMAFVAHQANALVYDNALEMRHAAELNTSLNVGSAQGVHAYYMQQYLPLVQAAKGQGEVVAQHYAGKHANFMARYHALASQKAQPNELELQFFFKHAGVEQAPVVDSKRVTEVAKEIGTGWIMSGMGKVFSSDSVPLVEPKALAAKVVKGLPGIRDVDAEYESYLREHRNLSVIGGHFWDTPLNATRVDDWLKKDPLKQIAPGEVNRATRLTIDKAAKEVGIDGNPTVYQIVDSNGEPNLFLVGVADDGVTTRMRHVRAGEILTNWTQSKLPAPASIDTSKTDLQLIVERNAAMEQARQKARTQSK